MNIKRAPGEFSITWQMWLVIFATAFGIYAGGMVSGYFVAMADYSHRAAMRDTKIDQIKKQIDQLPDKTAVAVKEDGK